MKPITTIVVAIMGVISSPAYAITEINCSNLKVHYAYKDSIGGMPPRPGQIVGSEYINVRDQLTRTQDVHYNKPELGWDLVIDIDETKVFFNQSGPGATNRKVFEGKLSLKKRVNGELLYEGAVTCSEFLGFPP